jgi:SAM-dependent methyltransferase
MVMRRDRQQIAPECTEDATPGTHSEREPVNLHSPDEPNPQDEPWWERYFDDDFLALYSPFLTRERTRAEVAGILEILALPFGARVLDLGCGWGRHAIELADAGLAVTGADLSATLLRHAEGFAGEADVVVDWVHSDMRAIPWTAEFDAVVSLFSSLGYFLSDEEDLRALRAARRALRPGGSFLLESMHRDQVAREYAERDWWLGANGQHVWVEREFDAVLGISREWVRWHGAEGVREKFHTLRVRSATEWNTLLQSAGFRPVEWYGNWNLDPFERDSEALIVHAIRVD